HSREHQGRAPVLIRSIDRAALGQQRGDFFGLPPLCRQKQIGAAVIGGISIQREQQSESSTLHKLLANGYWLLADSNALRSARPGAAVSSSATAAAAPIEIPPPARGTYPRTRASPPAAAPRPKWHRRIAASPGPGRRRATSSAPGFRSPTFG